MKVYLNKVKIEIKNRNIQSKKSEMTFYVESTEVSLKKEIIIEAKIGINNEDYHSLMIASFMVEIDDSKRSIDEIFLQALDFILPQIYLFIQILADCDEKQESIFYS